MKRPGNPYTTTRPAVTLGEHEQYTQICDQAEGFGIVNLLCFEPNTIGGPLTFQDFPANGATNAALRGGVFF